MAIARINGGMLQSNLERNGVNIQIDSALYVDVTNNRIGVNHANPAYTLDITGNAHLGNLYILGNTITTEPGKKLNLGSIDNVQITGGVANYIIYTDGAGNLSFGNLDVLSGLEGFTANYITLGSNTVGALSSNATALTVDSTVTNSIALINQVLGNVTNAGGNVVHVSGNVTAGNLVTNGSLTLNGIDVYANLTALAGNAAVQATWLANLDANLGSTTSNVTTLQANAATQAGQITALNANVSAANLAIATLQGQVYSNANVASYLLTNTGNIQAGNLLANISTNYITGNTTNVVTITGTGALKIPVGTTAQQPAGASGYIRFNTDTPALEYYNGAMWVPITNTVTDQQIVADGVNSVYDLDQTATTIGVIVSINGVLQRPTTAYTISGTYPSCQITFQETPQNGEVIDIRFLGASVTINSTLSDDLTVSGNVSATRMTLTSALQFANLTTAQVNTISAPARGMTVYNYTTGNIQVYNGSKWANVTLS